MITEKIVVGNLQENCYLAGDSDALCVIDPGDEADRILSVIEEKGYKVKYILLTHCHFDHVGAVYEIKEATGAKLVMPEAEKENYLSKNVSLSRFFGGGIKKTEPDILLKDGESIKAGNAEFKMILTPGHTSGSCSYLCENVLFSGDTLFDGSIGRTDFPTGDFSLIIKSINEKLFTLDDDVCVYSGHGEETTIGREKRENEFLKG